MMGQLSLRRQLSEKITVNSSGAAVASVTDAAEQMAEQAVELASVVWRVAGNHQDW